tara:strand:- start:1208 stop:1606 length:399 start_codon:yes stop_codon:yes gene_type:complete
MVGKNKDNYTKPAYQLFLDDYRDNLKKCERSNAKKVIKEGALAWSDLKTKALKYKYQTAIEKLNYYNEKAEKLRNAKINTNKKTTEELYEKYYVDFDNEDVFPDNDTDLDDRLDKQFMYSVAHPGCESTPYD